MAVTKYKVSPVSVCLAATTLMVLVAVSFFMTYRRAYAIERGIRLRNENDDLGRRNHALSGFGRDALLEARAQADLFRATLLSKDQVSRFVSEQQRTWQVSEIAKESNPEYHKIRYELVRKGASMSEWAGILETVRLLQNTPGMTVRKIDISTTGDEHQRSFERVAIGVTLFGRGIAGE
jgi:hypothetical protein